MELKSRLSKPRFHEIRQIMNILSSEHSGQSERIYLIAVDKCADASGIH